LWTKLIQISWVSLYPCSSSANHFKEQRFEWMKVQCDRYTDTHYNIIFIWYKLIIVLVIWSYIIIVSSIYSKENNKSTRINTHSWISLWDWIRSKNIFDIKVEVFLRVFQSFSIEKGFIFSVEKLSKIFMTFIQIDLRNLGIVYMRSSSNLLSPLYWKTNTLIRQKKFK